MFDEILDPIERAQAEFDFGSVLSLRGEEKLRFLAQDPTDPSLSEGHRMALEWVAYRNRRRVFVGHGSV